MLRYQNVKTKLAITDNRPIYSSPALTVEGNIIFGTNKTLVCIDKAGNTVWEIENKGRFEDSAALDCSIETSIIGTEENGQIVAFNSRTGRDRHRKRKKLYTKRVLGL
ncbi:hypothetical protein [Photorhabdus heterorhabditis]|uniref:hypothetical protein n=1 Tax=Photorhabdus heterorhabditis TaxID=880156 RepID=UPI0021D01934|nr:hypothetical protein [Photorhabdus heterorhabditis]